MLCVRLDDKGEPMAINGKEKVCANSGKDNIRKRLEECHDSYVLIT